MALVLGGIIFTDYALPKNVPLGGAHKFVTHRLMGGSRVVDAMGADDADISWSGRFQGEGAVAKAMALDQLRISGAQVPLVMESQFYMVGVSNFAWDYEASYQIIYRISCLVVSSLAGGFAPGVSLGGMVSADLAIAGSIISDFVSG